MLLCKRTYIFFVDSSIINNSYSIFQLGRELCLPLYKIWAVNKWNEWMLKGSNIKRIAPNEVAKTSLQSRIQRSQTFAWRGHSLLISARSLSALQRLTNDDIGTGTRYPCRKLKAQKPLSLICAAKMTLQNQYGFVNHCFIYLLYIIQNSFVIHIFSFVVKPRTSKLHTASNPDINQWAY